MSGYSGIGRARATTALGALALSVLLASCGIDHSGNADGPVAAVHTRDDGFTGTLVDDPPFTLADVVLNDTGGKPFHLAQLPTDRLTAVFFGFTHCDDVCPTTMADLAATRRALAPATARKVNVVFITVDPERDSAPALRSWLDRFDNTFVGLRGPIALVHEAERSLSSMPSAIEPANAGTHANNSHSSNGNTGYQVSHSGSIYVFGPRGRSLLYTGGTTVDEYAHDFTRMLRIS